MKLTFDFITQVTINKYYIYYMKKETKLWILQK